MKKTKILLALLISSVVGIQAGQATTTISCPSTPQQEKIGNAISYRYKTYGYTTGQIGAPILLINPELYKKIPNISKATVSGVKLVQEYVTKEMIMQCYYNNNTIYIQNPNSQFANCSVSGNSSIVCPD